MIPDFLKPGLSEDEILSVREELLQLHNSLGALTSQEAALYSSLDPEVIEEAHKDCDCFRKNSVSKWVAVL